MLAITTTAGGFGFIARWSGPTGQEGFAAVATDTKGDVYAIDGGADNLVEKFTSSGRFLTEWGGGGGTGHGQFGAGGAVAVATDRTGDTYVADENGNLIQKFTASGRFLAQWGGRFTSPEGVATDAGGNVYVVDGSNLIFKYGPAGSGPPSRCVVPNLRGKTLNAARKSLTKAGCRLGTVTPKGRTTGKVKTQNPRAGKTLRSGFKVNVVLGRRRRLG